MSPSMKSAFIGLLLLGLVVSETSATDNCPRLPDNLQACIAGSGISCLLYGVTNKCPGPCYQGLLGIRSYIEALGNPTKSCDCIRKYLRTVGLDVHDIVKLAGFCAVADLKICPS